MFDSLLEELGHVENVLACGGWANSADHLQDCAIQVPLAFPSAYRAASRLAPRARANRMVTLLEHVEITTAEVLRLLVQHMPVSKDLAERFARGMHELRTENRALNTA
jgi:hypothetical protein